VSFCGNFCLRIFCIGDSRRVCNGLLYNFCYQNLFLQENRCGLRILESAVELHSSESLDHVQ
jgi:hypothetical protein